MDLWITLHSSIITDICKTQQAMNKTFDKGLKKIDSSIVWDFSVSEMGLVSLNPEKSSKFWPFGKKYLSIITMNYIDLF